VADRAASDCLLYLWVTSPLVPAGVRVVEAWGFEYRTCMIWVKDKIGPGYWTRQRHELLFIATRGNPATPEPALRPDSVLHAPRTRHSAKPVQVHELLERLYPAVPKLELFARAPRPGWTVWGDELD
jgi:N6-adenosine-specific RNA methylase IME4